MTLPHARPTPTARRTSRRRASGLFGASGRRCAARFGLALGLLALSACSASMPKMARPHPSTDGPSARRFAAALMADLQGIASTMRYAETCSDVCRLTSRICEAAEKICEIAASEPADRELADRCGHARTHCVVARDRCQRCS